jgi:hypothetical protein
LFTEEFRFHMDFVDGRARVLGGRIEQVHPKNVIQCDHYGGGSVLIWGGINNYGKIDIVTVNGAPNS